MSDQARGLRRLAEVARLAVPRGADVPAGGAPAARPAFAIGSGKGGVGKSVLAVSLACALARRGLSTLLVDGAQNQGNLHVLLGVRPPARLDALAAADVAPRDLLVRVANDLDLLPEASGDHAMYGLSAVDRARLHLRLTGLYDDYDATVIDTGPGVESVVRATIRATRVIVVAVPEPAALSDAYATIKIVTLQVPALPIDVIVNRAASVDEAEAALERLRIAADRFLSRSIGYLGRVAEDDALRQAARVPGALLSERCAAVDEVAERFAALAMVAA